jgi:hypothetical protein
MDNREFPLLEYLIICAGVGMMWGAVYALVYFRVQMPEFYFKGFIVTMVGVIMFLPWIGKRK